MTIALVLLLMTAVIGGGVGMVAHRVPPKRPLALPPSRCRMCERLFGTMDWSKSLGHGARLCIACNEVVEAELERLLPAWFEKPLPEEKPKLTTQELVKQLEAGGSGGSGQVQVVTGCSQKCRLANHPQYWSCGGLACPNPNMNASVPNPVIRLCDWCENSTKGSQLCDTCIVCGPSPNSTRYRLYCAEKGIAP